MRRIDEYEIVLERSDGRAAHTLTRISGARPALGDEFEHGRRRYVIRRVVHRDDEVQQSTRVYTRATCYAMPIGARHRRRGAR